MKKNIVKIVVIVLSIMFIISANSYIYAKSINGISLNETNNSSITEEGATNTLIEIKEEQLEKTDDYKLKYGSDTEGEIAYWLNFIYIYLYIFHCLVWIICIIAN